MKEIKKQAIEAVSLSLPFSLKLFISPRGEAYLLNAQPSHVELKNYIDKLPFEKLIPLFWIKAGDKKALEKPLNDLLYQFAFMNKICYHEKKKREDANEANPSREEIREVK